MRWSRAASALLLGLAACSGPATPSAQPSASSSASASSPPPVSASASPSAGPFQPDHVVIVVFENKAFDRSRGTYMSRLADQSAVFTKSYAITHPSQPNYLALFSGSTQGVTSDRCLSRLRDRPNLGAQLIAAGHTFAGYSEGLPEPGYRGCYHGRYAAKHNPWVNFDNVPDSANLPFSAFPADYAQLPTVSFVVPDLCDDMHDCTVATGDKWAARHLEPYRQWAAGHDSLLIITFDEDDGRAGNQILTLVAGARVRPGTYAQRIDHYSVLRTLEEFWSLKPIGRAVTAKPMTGVWG